MESIAKDIIESGEVCKQFGVKNVFISGVPIRQKEYIQKRCTELNDILQEMCKHHGFIYIDNANINMSHVQQDGVHLTYEGSDLLANNYLSYLNSAYGWEHFLNPQS